MFRLCATRATCLAVSMTALSLSLQPSGELAVGAHAAGSGPAASRNASTGRGPLTGTLRSATKDDILLMQPGRKKLTHIQLKAKTRYIVHGKSVVKQPEFTPGLQVSVVASWVNGSYAAQVVRVGPSAPSSVVGAPSAGGPTASSPGTISITGDVTLTSTASVTLKTWHGIETIKLTAATRYVVKGKPSSFKPILHPGDNVRIVAVETNGVLVGRIFTIG